MVSESLEKLVSIARDAGKLLADAFTQQKNVQYKEDGSPVCDADIAVSNYLSQALTKNINLPVISEEAVVDYETRKLWPSYWLIDPLDGTREFVGGFNEFAINVALIEGTQPKLGLIYAPMLNELYVAERGQGAFRQVDGQWQKLPVSKPTTFISAKGRFQDPNVNEEFYQANNITDTRIIGASLKFCRLAEGTISIYPRYFRSKEWDTAAGQLIITESDCSIISIKTGLEPQYNKESFANDFFVACSNTIGLHRLKIVEVPK